MDMNSIRKTHPDPNKIGKKFAGGDEKEGFFPFIAILLFSSSLAISSVIYAMQMLSSLGIYKGMLEFFSESGIRMALFPREDSICMA